VFGVVVPAGKLAAGVDPGEVVAEVRGSEDLVAEEFRGVDAAHVQVEVERAGRREQVPDHLEPRRQHPDEPPEPTREPVRVRRDAAPGLGSELVPLCGRAAAGGPVPRDSHVKGVPGAEWWVQVHEVHPPGEHLEQRGQRPEVVAGDQVVRRIAGGTREPLDHAKGLDFAHRPPARPVRLVLAGPDKLEIGPCR
jgi:hypothetical protein